MRSSAAMSSYFGLRLVAIFEGAKGMVVLTAGLRLFELIHKDVQAAAERIVHHLHLNPASHYPKVFIDAMVRLDDSRLRLLAIGALIYSIVRFVEAVGLWGNRRWAAWFGALSGAIYLPLEAYTLWERVTWPRITIFLVNSIIVIYLAQVLVRKRTDPPKPAGAAP
jgi:uncharacterized membrane protein (DUF2068 family)